MNRALCLMTYLLLASLFHISTGAIDLKKELKKIRDKVKSKAPSKAEGKNTQPTERGANSSANWMRYGKDFYLLGEDILYDLDCEKVPENEFPETLIPLVGNVLIKSLNGTKYLHCYGNCSFALAVDRSMSENATIYAELWQDVHATGRTIVPDVEFRFVTAVEAANAYQLRGDSRGPFGFNLNQARS